jgi:hypothetical protein
VSITLAAPAVGLTVGGTRTAARVFVGAGGLVASALAVGWRVGATVGGGGMGVAVGNGADWQAINTKARSRIVVFRIKASSPS